MTKFDKFLSSYEGFVTEMEPSWDMAVDFIFEHFRQPTYTEWAIFDRVYDEVMEEVLN